MGRFFYGRCGRRSALVIDVLGVELAAQAGLEVVVAQHRAFDLAADDGLLYQDL